MSDSKFSDPVTLDSLRQEVDRLANQVKRNSNAIIETGRHVLAIEVDQEKNALKNMNKPPTSMRPQRRNSSGTDTQSILSSKSQQEGPSDTKAQDSSKYLEESSIDTNDQPLTSEDIVELVTELQGQLDLLDERSIRRTANAFVNDSTDVIAPLPGRDGELPQSDEDTPFPQTLGDFKSLDENQVEYWLRWYELLPPDEKELSSILARAGTTLDKMGMKTPQPVNIESDAHFDCLARFLGLRIRRVKGAW